MGCLGVIDAEERIRIGLSDREHGQIDNTCPKGKSSMGRTRVRRDPETTTRPVLPSVVRAAGHQIVQIREPAEEQRHGGRVV